MGSSTSCSGWRGSVLIQRHPQPCTPFPVADFPVNTLSLDALIKSKMAMGRPRDLAEVLELEALRDIAEQQRSAVKGGG